MTQKEADTRDTNGCLSRDSLVAPAFMTDRRMRLEVEEGRKEKGLILIETAD